jgi:large repetitive protein
VGRRLGTHSLKLALVVISVFAALAVGGASAADFDVDGGPCRETPGEALLLQCPTAYVGVPYEVQIESEEGSGCSPNYDWFEIRNSSLPAGLSMTRDGLISGTPTGAGLTRFWIWNHDLSYDQGGPSWCIRDDLSEREFSIPVDPGLAIDNATVGPATVGQPYSVTLTAKEVESLNPPSGPDVQAVWSLDSGTLPPGITLSSTGALAGTSTAEGSYGFVVKAENGSPVATKAYTLSVRQPVAVKSPFTAPPRASAEVGVPFSASASATGGSGTYTWAVSSGALPAGLTLDPSKGTVSGTPTAAGSSTLGLTATDSEGRSSTVNSSVRVAPRLAVKTQQLKPAEAGRAYRAKLATAGGAQPVKWRLASGKLPQGVHLSKTLGALVGTPRHAGTFRMTVEARDSFGAKAQKALVLRVGG